MNKRLYDDWMFVNAETSYLEPPASAVRPNTRRQLSYKELRVEQRIEQKIEEENQFRSSCGYDARRGDKIHSNNIEMR